MFWLKNKKIIFCNTLFTNLSLRIFTIFDNIQMFNHMDTILNGNTFFQSGLLIIVKETKSATMNIFRFFFIFFLNHL